METAFWRGVFGFALFFALPCVGEVRLSDSLQLDPSSQFELVFRGTNLFKRTRELRPEEEARAEQLRSHAYGLVRALGTGVWSFLTQAPRVGDPPHPISTDDFEFIKSRWASLPVRVCVESCPCSGLDAMGCGLTASRDAFLATALMVHPCALGTESATVCQKLARDLKNQTRGSPSTEAVLGLATGMIEAGLAQLWGNAAFRANRTLSARAAALMKKASLQLEGLARSCPGPYTRAGQSYLESVGALEELPSTWTVCAVRLVEPFRSQEVRSTCKRIADASAWEKWITRGILRTPVGARRCDGVCELATGCFGSDSPRIPRPLVFGLDAYLSLPKGACEGKTPQAPGEFFRVMLERFAREEIKESDRQACLEAVARAYQKGAVLAPVSDTTGPRALAPPATPTGGPTLPPLPAELDLPADL